MAHIGHAVPPTKEQLRQWFDAIDRDRSGYLTVPELQHALGLGGLNFDLKTVAHIIRIHDKEGDGRISFVEFEALHMFLTNIQASFEYFDKNKSSDLTYDEMHEALKHAGYNLDRTALQTVFERFDPLRLRKLGLPEFLSLSLFLRSATATFNAFDAQRTGFIHLNFNQFLYAAANTM